MSMSLALASNTLGQRMVESESRRSHGDGRRVGRWHLATSAVTFAIALAAVLVAVLAGLTPTGSKTTAGATSLHALAMSLLVWLPGISFSVGPLWFTSDWGQRAIRARWVSLGLFSLGSFVLVVGELLSRQPHGLRFYLRYFETGYRYTIGQSCGLAIVAIALAINGWLWLTRAKQTLAEAPNSSSFLVSLSVTGFVHVMLAPVAVALPILMFYERLRGRGVFLPILGGDAALLPELFWMYVQPLMLVTALPVFGLLDEWLARGAEDTFAPRILTASFGVSMATLLLFAWGNRPEVVLSDSTRGFFTATGLFGVLCFGHPIATACRELGRIRLRNWDRANAALVIATLAAGSAMLIALILPVASMRWAGTLFESAQIHLFGLAVSALPVGLAVQALRSASRSPARSRTTADVLVGSDSENDNAPPQRAHTA